MRNITMISAQANGAIGVKTIHLSALRWLHYRPHESAGIGGIHKTSEVLSHGCVYQEAGRAAASHSFAQ